MKEKIEDFIDNIGYYYKNIKYFINDIFYGIKNIITYAPLIYRDRDWDFSYIDIMLRFKLKRMSELLRINDRHTTTQQYVKQINFCIKLLDRLIADDYIHPDFEKTFNERSTSDILTGKNKNFTDEDFSKWMKYEAYLREKDRCVLENIMKKHMTGWWY